MDSFVAGAAAGLVVDLALYPIDTIKTRQQSKDGFCNAGGFRGVYRGLSAVLIGSVPGGAAFFFGYDVTKRVLLGDEATGAGAAPGAPRLLAAQAVAAVAGETLACFVRVPTEMVKQRLQAGRHRSVRCALVHITHNISFAALTQVEPKGIRWSGLPRLFTGIPITLLRELPFAVTQMSCYEGLKAWFRTAEHPQLLPLCGALSGGTAAFITTPLDVLKTRVMLGQVGEINDVQFRGIGVIRVALYELLHEKPRPTDKWGPVQRFFRGVVPRVMWISIGGSVFFTTYEVARRCYHTWAASLRNERFT